jgi:hypothetical protein
MHLGTKFAAFSLSFIVLQMHDFDILEYILCCTFERKSKGFASKMCLWLTSETYIYSNIQTMLNNFETNFFLKLQYAHALI